MAIINNAPENIEVHNSAETPHVHINVTIAAAPLFMTKNIPMINAMTRINVAMATF